MANYYLHIKNGGKGYGKSHAEYICREGKYKLRKDEELVLKEHLNMPKWATDNPINFWEQADLKERENGRSYKGIVLSLPNELSEEEQINLTRDFIKKEIGDNYVCSYAIHTKEASMKKGTKQPHAHIMLSERKLDGIERSPEQFFKRANRKNPELGGAMKDRSWHEMSKVHELRKNWEEVQNEYLKKHNIAERVDCRKLTEIKKEALANNDLAKANLYDREPIILVNKKKIREYLKTISNTKAVDEAIDVEIKLMLVRKEIKKRKEAEYKLTQEYNQIKNPSENERIEYECTLKEIATIVDSRCEELHEQNYLLRARIKDMERRLMKIERISDPERLDKIAINKLAKNKEKILEKDYKSLYEKRLKLESDYNKEKENMPSFFNYFSRQEVQEKLEKMNQEIKGFHRKENENRNEYNSLIHNYSYGDNLNKKIKIKKTMIDRNINTKERIVNAIITSNDSIASNNKLLKEFGLFSHAGLKLKNLNPKSKVKFSKPLSKKNISSAINKLTREAQTGNAHWNIKLGENNYEQETSRT